MNGIRIGICQWAIPYLDYIDLGEIVKLGIQGIELELGNSENGFPLSNSKIQKNLLSRKVDLGIQYPSIAVNELNTNGMTNNFDSIKGTIAREAIERGIDAARSLDVPLVQLPSFEDGEIKTEKGFENTMVFIRYALEYSEGSDIIIGIENLLSAEDNIGLIKKINSQRLKVYFDLQNHFLFRGYNCSEMILLLKDHICEVHAKDGSQGKISSALLGAGDSGIAESINALKEIGYSGWIILENYFGAYPLVKSEDPLELMEKDINYIKAHLDQKFF